MSIKKILYHNNIVLTCIQYNHLDYRKNETVLEVHQMDMESEWHLL